MALIFSLVIGVQTSRGYDIPKTIPGDFEGKWYGFHCSAVERSKILGVRYGEAFPDQKIINSWGYKARPIEEIKDLLPGFFYDICTHPEAWGNIW